MFLPRVELKERRYYFTKILFGYFWYEILGCLMLLHVTLDQDNRNSDHKIEMKITRVK